MDGDGIQRAGRCLECGRIDHEGPTKHCDTCDNEYHVCRVHSEAPCPCRSAHPTRYSLWTKMKRWEWVDTMTCHGTHVVAMMRECERCKGWVCHPDEGNMTRQDCMFCRRPFHWCLPKCYTQRQYTVIPLVCRECVNTDKYKALERPGCPLVPYPAYEDPDCHVMRRRLEQVYGDVMAIAPLYYAVAGVRAVKSIRVAIHGFDPEYTVQPRWMEDGRIVHHIETEEKVEPGRKLFVEPRMAEIKEIKPDLFVVKLNVTNLYGSHLTVGLHATRERAEQQVARLKKLR